MKVYARRKLVKCNQSKCKMNIYMKPYSLCPPCWTFVCLNTETPLFYCPRHWVSILVEKKGNR